MKLTPDTLAILKNFSGINQSLLFKQGSTLSTISTQKNTLATANVSEVFPKEFAIYDLNEFLSVVSLFSNPTFEVKDDYVLIVEEKGRANAKYYYADASMIVTPPEDKSKMVKAIKSAEISFLLSESDLTSLEKFGRTLGSPDVAVESDGTEIRLVTLDTKNVTSNNFSITLSEGNGTSFRMVFKADNLKLLKGSYEVSISSMLISYFKNTDIDLEYYISLEQSSKYGD